MNRIDSMIGWAVSLSAASAFALGALSVRMMTVSPATSTIVKVVRWSSIHVVRSGVAPLSVTRITAGPTAA